MTLKIWDWLIVAIYGIVVISIGLYVSKKPKTSEGYFLAGRKLTWPFVGASLYAANISAEMFVGLAAAGFAWGMGGNCFDWNAVICLTPLIVLLLPFYIKNKIYTVPEFLERRYSPGVRLVLSGFMVVLCVLTKISISVWAASIVFHNIFGWNQLTVIWVIGLITALYTMKGGLKAVVYTDAIQAAVLITAATVMSVVGMHHVGGWAGLRAKLDPEMFHVVKSATHPDLPWPGVFISLMWAASFTWAMDQVHVQRVFAAKTLNEGRKGAIFCQFLKIVNPFILVLPGLIAKALFPHIARADDAYPTMLKNLMPTGLLGLTVAGLTAALMGHLSATYNSVATMFTRDFYLRWRPRASNDRQILVGRISIILVCVLGALWAPVIGQFKNLWVYLQSVSVFLIIPFTGVFFIGVLWKRINTAGALASILVGWVIGIAFAINMQTHFLPFMRHPLLVPWLNAAILQEFACILILVVVSLATAPMPKEKLVDTTITRGCLVDDTEEKGRSFIHDYRPWLALALTALAIIWYVMR